MFNIQLWSNHATTHYCTIFFTFRTLCPYFKTYVYSRLEKAVFAVEVLSHDDDFLPFLLWRISCSHGHSLAHFWDTSLQLVFRQVYNMSGMSMTTKKSSDGSNRGRSGNIQGKNYLFIQLYKLLFVWPWWAFEMW